MKEKAPFFPKPEDWTPEKAFSEGHAWAGTARCQRWIAKRGVQCSRRPAKGRETCKFHQGTVSRGAAHYNFKTGENTIHRYRLTDEELLRGYTAAMEDAALLSLTPEVALVQAAIGKYLAASQEDKEDIHPAWTLVLKEIRKARKALKAANPEGLVEAIESAHEVALPHARATRAFQAALSHVDQKGRIAEKERKLREELKRTVLVQEALRLLSSQLVDFREILIRTFGETEETKDVLVSAHGNFEGLVRVLFSAGTVGMTQ